jgi:arylsulfatase
MEVYAGFLEHTDHHVGRLLEAIEDLGIMDDTLIYYIIGDNGASAEGTVNGAFNEMANFNGMAALETPEFMVSKLDEFGSPSAYNHYAVGWAWAMNTPYQWTKQVASHWGGTRNGTIVNWPNGINEKGGLRSQFCHDLQYFEMFGNRGIYHKGWSAVTKHRTPWQLVGGTVPPFDEDVWELYDGSKDFSQAQDLAKEMPDKLRELQRLWLIEATKYNVIPLDDRTAERANAELAGRPQLLRGNSQLLFGHMGRLSENSVLNIKNKSFSVTAELEITNGPAEGVIVAQGGRLGGWSLYAKDGKAKFVYNLLGIREFPTEATEPIPAGKHQVRMEFAYDGGGLAKGGNVTLYYDGEKVGEGRAEATQPLIFSADETTDVGYESGTPVTADYPRDGRFTGKIDWVQIDLGEDDHGHMIDPEEHLHMLMSKQ